MGRVAWRDGTDGFPMGPGGEANDVRALPEDVTPFLSKASF